MRFHSEEPDFTTLDLFSVSSRKRQAGITVAERAARSTTKRQQAQPTTMNTSVRKYNSRGERLHQGHTLLEWAEL